METTTLSDKRNAYHKKPRRLENPFLSPSAEPNEPREPSVPERIAEIIRDSVMGGMLQPGDPIVESKLARQLSVGQPAVREALLALEAEGLIVRQPKRGCSVTKLTREDVAMLRRISSELSGIAIEAGLTLWSVTKAERFDSVIAEIREAVADNNRPGFFAAALRFHRMVWRLPENPFLERALAQSAVPLFAFELPRAVNEGDITMEEAARGLEAILTACTTKDPAKAKRALTEGAYAWLGQPPS